MKERRLLYFESPERRNTQDEVNRPKPQEYSKNMRAPKDTSKKEENIQNEKNERAKEIERFEASFNVPKEVKSAIIDWESDDSIKPKDTRYEALMKYVALQLDMENVDSDTYGLNVFDKGEDIKDRYEVRIDRRDWMKKKQGPKTLGVLLFDQDGDLGSVTNYKGSREYHTKNKVLFHHMRTPEIMVLEKAEKAGYKIRQGSNHNQLAQFKERIYTDVVSPDGQVTYFVNDFWDVLGQEREVVNFLAEKIREEK